MGDEQCRAAAHDGAQRGMDGLFHLGVDRAGGVVEHEDPRVAQQCPGKGDPLALSARQGEAPFTDDCLIAAGKLLDELVRTCRAGRRLDLLK